MRFTAVQQLSWRDNFAEYQTISNDSLSPCNSWASRYSSEVSGHNDQSLLHFLTLLSQFFIVNEFPVNIFLICLNTLVYKISTHNTCSLNANIS